MRQVGGTLRMYANNGLRTVEDWTALGRDVTAGAKSRLDTPDRGVMVPLYSRDQTQLHLRTNSERV